MNKGKPGLKSFAKHTAGIFMPQKSTFTCSLVDVRTVNGFDSVILSLKEFAYGAIMGLCISYSSKGLQQEPRKIYSQLAMPGNICNLHIQFTRFLLLCLPPPGASKLEKLLTFLLLWRDQTWVTFHHETGNAVCWSLLSEHYLFLQMLRSPSRLTNL